MSSVPRPPIQGFYPPTVVASLVTCLLRNATPDGLGFSNVRDQLVSALDLANNSTGPSAADYRRKVQTVLDFFDASPANQDLFRNVHVDLMLLLQALVDTNNWSGCFHVNQVTVEQIFNLP